MPGQIGPPPEQREHLAPQLVVFQDLRLPSRSEPHPHLLSRRQRPRIGGYFLVRDDAQLRRGKQLPVGFPDPERPQPHGIDAEDAPGRGAGR